MAGVIYDVNEGLTMQDLLNKENTQMDLIDKEKANTDSKVLRYSIIIAGAIITLVTFKYFISKRK